MKKKAAILTAVVVFALSSISVYAESVPIAVDACIKSVVRVSSDSSFGSRETTGIVIGKDGGYILAGLDGVENSKGDIVVHHDEEQVNAELIVENKLMNIAILKLPEEEALEGTKPAELDSSSKKNNTEAYIISYKALSESDAIISGEIESSAAMTVDGSGDVDIYTLTTDITKTESGAMLADKHGNLAGICMYDGNTYDDKAVQAAEICTFLDDNGIEYRTPSIIIPIAAAAAIAALAAVLICMLTVKLRRARSEQPVIRVTEGELKGKVIPLRSDIINIGRDPKCCQIVILKDPTVSRCHCSIKYDSNNKKFILTDLSSTHGTFLDSGMRLEPNMPASIPPGKVFRIGDGGTAFEVSGGGGDIL